MEPEVIRFQRHCEQGKDKRVIKLTKRVRVNQGVGNLWVGTLPHPGEREPKELEPASERMRRRIGALTESVRRWTRLPA